MQNVRLRRSLTDYGLAVGATLLACAAQLAMQRLPGEPPPYIAFYPALMIAALQGGLGPGLLATGVAALLAGWLILPVAGGAVSLALFSGVGLFICIVAELYRRRRDRALRDSELSAQAELARAAEALRSSQDMLRESLAASEQRLRLATQSGQIGVQEIDLATGEARLDELTARMLGIKPGERLTMERYVQEFLHPEDAVHLLPQFLKWLESNEDHWGAEYRIRRPDGEERWIQDDYLAIRDESGKPLRAIGVSSDITRHKRAEQALRQSKEMLRLVLDTVPVRVFWKDLNGVFLGCNQHFARDAGLESPDEIIGRDDYAMGWRDQARLYRADDQAIMQSGQAKLGYEEPQTAPNGHLLWLRTSKIPLRGPDGKVFGVLGTYEDITERKRAELTLRESEERFKALAAATFEGIAIEEGGRLVDANEQFLNMLGYSRDELIGMEVEALVPPEDRELVRRTVVAARRAHLEHSLLCKTGGRVTAEVRVTPVRYQNRTVRFAAVRDITEQRRAEKALAAAKLSAERAMAIAEAASHAKDQFLAVLSHELRTPLTPVLGAVSMLARDTRLSAELRDKLDIVLRNVKLEARLIDDLLDVTRIARGKLEMHRRPVQLGDVIRQAVEVCMPEIQSRRLEFCLDLGEAGICTIDADATRLQQVFWNLLSNAIKFTPAGGRIGIRCRRTDSRLVTEVSDSGIGIEPDLLPRLFTAFEQAERHTTRQFGGLGLGLAISKALVEMHGGTIAAGSPGRGRGATFSVTLPVGADTVGGAQAARPARPSAKEKRGLQILLVEDHADTARIISQLLRAAGHCVTTVGTVSAALHEAGKGEFDLLISDLGLPDGSGVELLQNVRAGGNDLPAIALTGYGREEDMRRTREAGFHTHLTKPIDFDQLQRAVAEAAVAAG